MRILELFCGIGGCAAALRADDEIAMAVDIDTQALAIYRANFPFPAVAREIESLPSRWFEQVAADVWWMSPPCQPYTRRGARRDLEDRRAASLIRLMQRIRDVRPPCIALENVPEFADSRAWEMLRRTLDDAGYASRLEVWCPTRFGIPNRRRRAYVVASRRSLPPPLHPALPVGPIADYVDHHSSTVPRLMVRDLWLRQYRNAMHIVRADDSGAITTCFTAAYGHSPVRSGSYLQCGERVRHFSPREIARFLGFPRTFSFGSLDTPRPLWRLLGNSVSVPVVRWILNDCRAALQS